MGFLKNLFGGKKEMSEEEKIEKARELFTESEMLSNSTPKAALNNLRKKGKALYSVIGINGSLYEELKSLVKKIMIRNNPQDGVFEFPTVEMHPWEMWERPEMKDIAALAESSDKEIIYCTESESRRHNDIISELEALRIFAKEDDQAMITLGEMDMMFRKIFILAASEGLPPEAEELGQDLEDFAKSRGLKSCFFVV
jgi:hypothetical protein